MSAVRPQELLERALAASRSEQCAVIVHDATSVNLRWANNTLTTNGVTHGLAITVIAFHGAGNASVSGTATTVEQVLDLVEAADRAASEATAAEDRAELAAASVSADWEEPAALTSVEVFAPFVAELGPALDEAEQERRILYGFVSHEVLTTYLGTSTGLRLRHVQPTGHYGCTGKDAGLASSAWVGGATPDFHDVSARGLATELARRLAWGERKMALPAGRYDTVLPPTAVADLMVEAYGNAGARVAQDGQTVYARPGGGTRVGEQLVAPGVQLFSDPHHAGLECIPFVVAGASSEESSVYDNGIALQRTPWLSDGVLTSLIQTRHTAALTGLSTTPAIDNLVLEVDGGTGDVDDLAANVQDGLLLTCLWYIREVDPQTLLLTGLTRDGVYRVQGGEITGAVNNFRFNESPLDLLRRFSASSATSASFSREWGEDYFSRTATPALRIPDFNMSSVSPAV